ncbi:MAG: pilus assembly protein PilP [Rhodanobacteraceae bacterium]
MNTHTTRIASVALLSTAVLLMAGCVGGRSDLEQWVAQQKARKGAPLPALPVVKTFETFIYQDQDLRDPFASPANKDEKTASTQGPSPNPDRVKEPLESFALDSLKMVGTIGTGPKAQALLEDADGVIHRVHDGNYAGQNYGHIISITEDNIELVELVPDGNGGWMERKANIALGGENP